MISNKVTYTSVVMTILFYGSYAFGHQPAPPTPPGNPDSIKFWNVSEEQYKSDTAEFLGNSERYKYFAGSFTGVEVSKDGSKDKSYNIGPESNISKNSVGLLDKIVLLKHLDKSNKEISAIRNMNRFLSTNFKTQILPSEIYNNSDLPRPFYLSDLKSWSFAAVGNNDIDLLRALLDNYNLLDIKNNDGEGLLSYAVLHDNVDIVRFLIKRGVNINEIDHNHTTPLMIAAKNNNIEIVKILTSSGCHIESKDTFGNAPIDYSVMNNNRHINQYLLGLIKK